MQEEENFSTALAIGFTVPVVLVLSGLAGGAMEMETEGFRNGG